MASRLEALASLKQWFDSGSLLDCFVIASIPPIDPQGEITKMSREYFSVKISFLDSTLLSIRTEDGLVASFSLPTESNFWCLDADDIDPISLPKGVYGKRIQWELTSLTVVIIANRIK